MTESNDVNLHY